MKHIEPDMISADVVSHTGISKYAEKFRKALVDYLYKNDCLFFTTAAHGFGFT